VIYRFGPYTLDPSAYRLTRDREVIQLSPKIIDLLLYLVARQPALVSKDDLFKALWPDVAVTDNALTQAVSELRQALHDDPAKPAYIQTVARRGYRFIAPVTGAQTSPATMPALAPTEVVRESAALPVIAVLDFTNVTGDRELGWLASGIAETVTNDLRAIAPMRVVDRLRVVEAVRRSGSELSSIRADLHLDLAVVGSFQRAGNRLRITARVVDAATGEATAEAKADGALEQVFELQDRIVGQFADVLWAGGRQVRTVADTSSLDAYRSYTEGRVKLESLDASFVAAAIADFERAISLDPRYAAAHVGLANARFWQYEASRPKNQPEASLLARAIDHVRKAIEIERDLAEAHATLSFLLISAGRAGEALVSARRAVGLEPRYWGNQFRLAHAAWGEERLQALARTIDLYQDFPFVHFEMAMVHIARGHLDRAEPVLREGTVVQDRQADRKQRFPAKGLHWLLGLVRLACGDEAEARQEFVRELASGQSQLYAREFAMNAHDGAGFASMTSGDHAGAIEQFSQALALFPAHARSLVGLAAARAAGGDAAGAESSFAAAATAIDDLRRGGRHSEAALAEAMLRTVCGDIPAAIASLTTLLERPDLPFSGWTIPIEPLLAPVRRHAAYEAVRARLAERAR
jgi:DNA-binding winged helix-turn-helix (wHTH) protein/tetratricopeptide (TPR) repeat protein